MDSKDKFVHHTLEEDPIPASKAFVFAMSGIAHAIKTQRNFKIHIAVGILAIALSFILKISLVEAALVAICIFAVFAFELINTSIESVVDLVSPEWSKLAKHAKDCAAGAVLLVAIMSVFVAAFIFVPKILNLWI